MSLINEFRQDLVSGEWVLFATGRAKRPSADVAPRVKPDLSQCPFEDPEASGNEVLVTYLPDPDIDVTVDAQGQETGNQGRNSGVAISALGKEVSGNKVTNLNSDIANQKLNQSWQSDYQKAVDGGTDFNKGAISAPGRWFAKVAKNKFPAVAEGEAGPRQAVGPFLITEARGLHELIIYRDHERQLHEYSVTELGQVLAIYQARYRAMADYAASRYILIFHNKGLSAGASQAHPHSQIISIPILPPDVKRSIFGSESYYKQNGKRVYDVMIDWETKEGKRIVQQTDNFIAFCPFVSKTPYEVRIFSKQSHAHFEQCPAELLPELGGVIKTVLQAIEQKLNAADFNFFIHTAPVERSGSTNPHDYYSWHIEILPKMKMEGAFELGSGVEVNVVDPDQAAQILRGE